MDEKNILKKQKESSIIIYQSADGKTKIDVKLENENIWLNQKQMSDLFGVEVPAVLKHIKNIFEVGELSEDSTISKMEIVQQEGERLVKREITFYNLDAIISVGYRVNSITAVHFRQWATQKLKEYIIKGFVLDDERLKLAKNNYFDELLERIRDIRSSEKVFYRKILDIYATSIDYDSNTEMTQNFFSTIQNKIHWAIHGHTAAEVIFERACGDKDFMGMTTFRGRKITKKRQKLQRIILSEKELAILNRIVNMYLDYAELQALENKAMKMEDWINKLDIFLKMTNKNILEHNGKISKLQADKKANIEYEKI